MFHGKPSNFVAELRLYAMSKTKISCNVSNLCGIPGSNLVAVSQLEKNPTRNVSNQPKIDALNQNGRHSVSFQAWPTERLCCGSIYLKHVNWNSCYEMKLASGAEFFKNWLLENVFSGFIHDRHAYHISFFENIHSTAINGSNPSQQRFQTKMAMTTCAC